MAEKHLDDELRACFFKNDMEGFGRALDRGADPNCREDEGRFAATLLCQAVSDANGEAVRLLLAHDADVVDSKMHVTAPLLAVFHGNFEILDQFFAAIPLERLDVTVRTSSTLVLQAVNRRNFDMIRYLLERGYSVNARNEEMWDHTPLEYAVRNDDVEMVRFLLELGADPSALGLSNHTALESAEDPALTNGAEILGLLLRAQATVDLRAEEK